MSKQFDVMLFEDDKKPVDIIISEITRHGDSDRAEILVKLCLTKVEADCLYIELQNALYGKEM